MIYKFKSETDSDVIMMGPTGDQVLRLIGKEPAAKGIIESADMPAAMRALEQAVTADDAARARPEPEVDDKEDADDTQPAKRDPISLRQRVWPLVEAMKRSHAAGTPIVWGV